MWPSATRRLSVGRKDTAKLKQPAAQLLRACSPLGQRLQGPAETRISSGLGPQILFHASCVTHFMMSWWHAADGDVHAQFYIRV